MLHILHVVRLKRLLNSDLGQIYMTETPLTGARKMHVYRN